MRGQFVSSTCWVFYGCKYWKPTQTALNYKGKYKTVLLWGEPLGPVCLRASWASLQFFQLCLPSLHFQADSLMVAKHDSAPLCTPLRQPKHINTKFPREIMRFSLIIAYQLYNPIESMRKSYCYSHFVER